jgi:STE24 endopeptidase
MLRTIFSVGSRLRLPAVLVTALVVAEAGVVILRPRDRGPKPVPVEARAYFSAGQLEKAESFRTGQRRLFLIRVGVEGALLAFLVARPPRVAAGRLGLLRRRRVLAGAAAGAALSLALTVVTLPVAAMARERGKDVGLVTQDWVGWAGDLVKGEAIGAALAAAGGGLLVLALGRFGRRWWIPGAVAVVAFGALMTYAGPVVLDPVFNRFDRLPDGPARSDVLDLARRAGVDVGEVYVVDASRRTSAANAYVTGLGQTKRVVLYDNLLEDFDPAEVRLVVAHELGHVRHRDVPHGLLYLALVAPFGTLAVARLAEAFGARTASARAVPAAALAVALLAPAITAVSNQLSRAVERRADAFAIELTHEPRTQIEFQRRIAIKNVGDPDPPGWVQVLFGTHPTTLERIGVAERLLRT